VSVPLTSGVPRDIVVDRDGGRHSTLVPIAVSTAGTVVSVECNCTPKNHEGFGFHELSFDIVRFSGTDVFTIQNRLVARKVLPQGGVHLVLSIVLASYSRLIQVAQPDFVYRCSAFTGLQEAPLRKHRFINEAIQICGFEISESGRDASGRSFWLHERTIGRPTVLFDIAKFDPVAAERRKARVAGYVSETVHGEMRLLSGEAAAKHEERIKTALRIYALDISQRERQRPAA
jgi:hypothetical protein